ncbi:vesicular glutamate transporter 1 [Ceratina calcarata]|uniref:Vesicular glutamate transporter 1 n=1 Tax=Ceratina calcarata TaxID=156304 RepID=A0AAJ7WEM2_9HYME|nr:vesicular glutamate transporter 1 [Ceratina calcarata]
MLRINLNLTIVTMVVPRVKKDYVSECMTRDIYSSNVTTPKSDEYTGGDRFHWTEYQQGLALGAFYWFHWLTQLPGGILARRYGTKLVYGLGNLITALIGFLIPWLTWYHFNALVVLRVLQGLIAGVVWPSMHDMTAKWIPPNERSRFVSAYLGSSVGAAITYPLCATVTNWFNWGAAFHVTSMLGVIWSCFWYFLVYNSPEEHPRISDEEKKHILDSIATSVQKTETRIPWKSIFTSRPVWITIIAQWGGAWGLLTLMTQSPTYFTFIHGWDLRVTGILSGAPHILRAIFSVYYSKMSDWLIRTNKMRLTNVRKMATCVSVGLQGVFILALGFSGCYPILAAFFLMMGTMVNGAVSASTLAAFVDMSPNYASILLGFCGMVVIITGFISPMVVGLLTDNNQTVAQWQLVFIIAALNTISCTIVYVIWGSSDEQPWNSYGKSSQENEREMQKLTETPKTL